MQIQKFWFEKHEKLYWLVPERKIVHKNKTNPVRKLSGQTKRLFVLKFSNHFYHLHTCFIVKKLILASGQLSLSSMGRRREFAILCFVGFFSVLASAVDVLSPKGVNFEGSF